jgi:hypothetical protein
MHDIGRTQQEYLGEQEFQPEVLEAGGLGETYGETGEAFEGGFQEAGFETFESLESPINEALEMELASELLEVTNEQELDRFLGDLIKKVGRAAGKFISSPIGRGLLGVLKPLVKKVLPIAAGAAGSIFGGPLGGLVGSQVSNLATKAFGLELEGMSSEDAQFEVARRAVRLASAATTAAAAAPQAADPRTTAQLAVTTAAQQHAPGLLRAGAAIGGAVPSGAPGFAAGGFTQPQGPSYLRRRGIWIRRGRRILLLGV